MLPVEDVRAAPVSWCRTTHCGIPHRRSAMRPVWDGNAFQPRLILPLSLSWDHRVVDGAAAARFNTYFAQLLGDFRRVLL